MIAELEAMREQGMEIAYIADDNLMGNKIAMKKLLRDVAAWQAAEGYPLLFFTGLEVTCGLIVGFDHDDTRIFKAQREFLRQTDITLATLNMLVAIPKTPLYARLKNEGRLDLSTTNPSDGMFGTNVIPLGMTRDELRDGYDGLLLYLTDPEFYFERLENLYLKRRFNFARTRDAYWRRHPWTKRKSQSFDALRAIALFLRLMRNIPDPELRRIYRLRMTTMLRHRPDPTLLFACVVKCAMHYHHYTMSRQIIGQHRLVNAY